ncbi:GNAT family N-acetyltransferase [Arthrobacter rhizosphaerae]|uniref:GNAT family N-acetyltransferase n=1 Tax=Arthrobacter rhizosphaerae TaxID=2855490 RepID=UPI001FF6B0DE|nr:GNAT family N-acetyltransferase [Arthrobacter rhizosphaerae]
MTSPPYLIEPLVLPASLEHPDAEEFLEFNALTDARVLETWGNLDRATPPAARLEAWRDDSYKQFRMYFIRNEGTMVARSWIWFPLKENLGDALVRVDVLNAFEGKGMGQQLLRHAETLAAERGRRTLQSFTEHPAAFDPDGPGLLKPATRTGGVPANDRPVRFALAAGYRLEQVARFSALDMPPAEATLAALEAQAWSVAGDQYELLGWKDRCPEEYLDQLSVLMGRMSIDAPAGGLHIEAADWDAVRVRHVEDTWKLSGKESFVAAAMHKDTGELAAYSVLQFSRAKPWMADQDDTLVAKAHRGHRLGMLVKIHNLRSLMAAHTSVERVLTFNAAENEHMLAINVALGFLPAGYDGEWQRMLP